jgi:hypothetical protein
MLFTASNSLGAVDTTSGIIAESVNSVEMSAAKACVQIRRPESRKNTIFLYYEFFWTSIIKISYKKFL